MNYQDFINTIRDFMEDKLTEGQKISLRTVTKNNGAKYDGLFITDPILNVSPTIYLNPYYHRYLSGVSMEDIQKDILSTYHENLPMQNFDVTLFTDFSKAKERIVIKLIHYQRNKALLTDIPHVRLLDLAIVFVCLVSDCMKEYATILIHNKHLTLWNITTEELHEIALQNSPLLLPSRMDDMETFLCDITSEQFSQLDNLKMYILTNSCKIHGAACMVYPKLLASIADSFQSNLIILPSSIHEILLIPENNCDPELGLNDMIREINETELTDEEILSDNAYLYQLSTDNLSFYPQS